MFSVVESAMSIVERDDAELVDVCLVLLSPAAVLLQTEIYIEVDSK